MKRVLRSIHRIRWNEALAVIAVAMTLMLMLVAGLLAQQPATRDVQVRPRAEESYAQILRGGQGKIYERYE